VEREDAEQLGELVALVREALGAGLVGAYLFGSATLGGLRHRSDLDVLAVTRASLDDEQRRALVRGLLAISGRPRPIELTTVAAGPWRYPPTRDFQYGEWLRRELEDGGPPTPTADPDLALLIHMTLQANRPLAGPPPREVFDPVPAGDLRRALHACVDDVLRGLDDDRTNLLLTLARVWVSLETGDIRPKDGAADWTLERLPPEHRPVLEHARAVYLGVEEEDWSELAAGVRPHAEHVVRRIGPPT
jgi:streptomycin 3"-adenylyltransferase